MKTKNKVYTQAELDNYSRHLDPENVVYWKSRGADKRPIDWKEKIKQGKD